mgnify:CR=1 FL=1
MTKKISNSAPIARRAFIAGAAAGGAVIAAPAIAQAKTIKLGYVSPQTGPLAAFAEADNFNVALFKERMKGGLKIGARTYPVDVIVKDSQSNPNRAAQVAKDLIVQDKIDLMLVASTPETTNPVSTQCEIEEQPCVSTMAPWQPWFIGRQANPAGGPPAWKGFNYTYHYFWGLEDIIAVFAGLVAVVFAIAMVAGKLPVNKYTIGVLGFSGTGAVIAQVIKARQRTGSAKKRKEKGS